LVQNHRMMKYYLMKYKAYIIKKKKKKKKKKKNQKKKKKKKNMDNVEPLEESIKNILTLQKKRKILRL